MSDAADCVTRDDVKRNAVINIRLPTEVKRALQRAADDDHGRSLSGMAVRLLHEWLVEHGYIEPTTKTAKTGRRT